MDGQARRISKSRIANFTKIPRNNIWLFWEFVLIGLINLKFFWDSNFFYLFCSLVDSAGRGRPHHSPPHPPHVTGHTASKLATVAFLARAVTTLVISLKFPTALLTQPNAAVHTLVQFAQPSFHYIVQCYVKRINRRNFNSRITSDRVIWPYWLIDWLRLGLRPRGIDAPRPQLTCPLCPISVYGSPVTLLKFQLAPRLIPGWW